MPYATTDDGVKLYYEETGTGTPIVFVHEFAGDHRSWEPQVRHFCAALPLHRLQRARLSALRRAGGRRQLFAGARARRHPRGARCTGDRQGAHRRPVDGRLRHAAFRLHLSATARCRSSSPAAATARSPSEREKFRAEAEAIAAALADRRHGRRSPRTTRYGPTRVQFENKDPRGFAEFKAMLAEHSAVGAANTQLGVQRERPSLYDLTRRCAAHRADAGHHRRRGLALPRARHPDEAEHPDGRAGGDAEQRPRHQSRGAGRSTAWSAISSTRSRPAAGQRAIRAPSAPDRPACANCSY